MDEEIKRVIGPFEIEYCRRAIVVIQTSLGQWVEFDNSSGTVYLCASTENSLLDNEREVINGKRD